MKELSSIIDTILPISHSRYDVWQKLIHALDIRVFAEIGVYRGEFAEAILKACPNINKYIMIDPWKHLDQWNKPANKDNQTFESYYKETFSRTLFAKNLISIYRDTSANSAPMLSDASIDCAYIDGDHTLRGIAIDLNCIYDKITESGLIAGDDFCPSIWQHAKQYEPTLVFPYAVYFAEAKGDHIYCLPYNQFLIHKQSGSDFQFFDLTGQYPRFQESCHPSDLNTRGLEDMINASLQRGRQS